MNDNFEHELRAKADQFSITPSSTVWANVEKSISTPASGSGSSNLLNFIGSLILPIALLGGGAFFFHQQYTNTSVKNEAAAVAPTAHELASVSISQDSNHPGVITIKATNLHSTLMQPIEILNIVAHSKTIAAKDTSVKKADRGVAKTKKSKKQKVAAETSTNSTTNMFFEETTTEK